VSTWLLGGVVGGVATVLASPYLARIARSAPDRDATAWWRGMPPGRAELAVTALVAAVLGVLAGHAAGWAAPLPAFVAFAGLATPLLLADVQHHRLPDRLVVPAAAGALALLTVAAGVRGDWPALARAAEAGGIVFGLFCAVTLASPSSLGFGDVKLAGIIAVYLGWLGWTRVFYGVFVGFLLGALVAVALLASRRASLKSNIALGPALIVGALLVAAVH